MNIRQLKKLVLETINEERKAISSQKRKKSRSNQLSKIMETANSILNEATVSDHVAAELKGNEGQDRSNLFATGGLPDLSPEEWQRVMAGAAQDLGIEFSGSPTTVKVKECAPTQSEIGVAQSLANPIGGNSHSGDGIMISSEEEMKKNLPPGGYNGKSKEAALAKAQELGVEGEYQAHQGGSPSFMFDPPVIVAKVKPEGLPTGTVYGIMDGHHRWSQAYMINPEADIQVIIAEASSYTADDFLQAIHLAVGALKAKQEGGDPEKTSSIVKKAKGGNLLGEQGGSAAVDPLAAKVRSKENMGYFTASNGFNTAIGKILAGGLDDAAGDEEKAEQIREAAVVAHFKATAEKVKDVGAYGKAPTRLGMPQADDHLGAGGGTAVLNALAGDEVFAPSSDSDVKSRADESSERKGNILSESASITEDAVLSRWKKLAGL